jgi:hypothetical protein
MKRIVFSINHGVTTTIESIKLEEEDVPIERIEKIHQKINHYYLQVNSLFKMKILNTKNIAAKLSKDKAEQNFCYLRNIRI